MIVRNGRHSSETCNRKTGLSTGACINWRPKIQRISFWHCALSCKSRTPLRQSRSRAMHIVTLYLHCICHTQKLVKTEMIWYYNLFAKQALRECTKLILEHDFKRIQDGVLYGVTRKRDGKFGVQISAEAKASFFTKASSLALGSNQPSIQDFFPWRQIWQDVRLTIHLRVVSTLGMS
jgi:hypothetical protein